MIVHPLSTPHGPLTIAHRGVTSVAPENSMAAFRAAVDNVELGVDGVELDVHSTADGKIVVHHDPDLPSGRGIAAMKAAEVQAEALPGGNPAPTLEEVLAVLGGLRVYVEAKGVAPGADAELLRVLRGGPNPAGYQVHAFDHRIIARLSSQARDFGYGVLSSSWPVDPVSPVWSAGAQMLWQQWAMVDRELMDRCNDRGIKVIAWTVPAAEADRLTALGVHGLCMDL
jgi:glycerophosphoryl diester phosphodiesterase